MKLANDGNLCGRCFENTSCIPGSAAASATATDDDDDDEDDDLLCSLSDKSVS